MFRTVRKLIERLLMGCGDIDEPVRIKIVRRDEHGVVTHCATAPISYVDSFNSICIEEPELHWTTLNKYEQQAWPPK